MPSPDCSSSHPQLVSSHPQLVSGASELASRITKALKIDLQCVRRVNLDIDAASIICCTVEFYPTLQQLESFAEMLETETNKYALVELQQTKDVTQSQPE